MRKQEKGEAREQVKVLVLDMKNYIFSVKEKDKREMGAGKVDM